MSKKQLALICLIFIFLLVIQSSPIINEIGAQIQGDSELSQEDIESPFIFFDF